jgi:gamma-glutamylcyclotransferase (GGCT)/AIG2-like uncharacterized protein YtfP
LTLEPEEILKMLVRVFVYGTLKPAELNRPDANEYQRSCLSQLINAEPAIASGHLYDLPEGYPAMVLGNALVHGFLLSFLDDTILPILDKYEGYEANSLNNDYDRISVEIFNAKQESLGFAWTYVMTREAVDHAQGVPIPNGIWTTKK